MQCERSERSQTGGDDDPRREGDLTKRGPSDRTRPVQQGWAADDVGYSLLGTVCAAQLTASCRSRHGLSTSYPYRHGAAQCYMACDCATLYGQTVRDDPSAGSNTCMRGAADIYGCSADAARPHPAPSCRGCEPVQRVLTRDAVKSARGDIGLNCHH